MAFKEILLPKVGTREMKRTKTILMFHFTEILTFHAMLLQILMNSETVSDNEVATASDGALADDIDRDVRKFSGL